MLFMIVSCSTAACILRGNDAWDYLLNMFLISRKSCMAMVFSAITNPVKQVRNSINTCLSLPC